MSRLVTRNVWTVRPGSETDFVAAWRTFAMWASDQPGAGALTLARDRDDGSTFVSFGFWESAASAHAAKASPEFLMRIDAVRRLCETFEPAELTLAAIVQRGSSIS